MTPAHITLDRRLHGESWRMSHHHHNDREAHERDRAEHKRHVARHLADAVRALEGMP